MQGIKEGILEVRMARKNGRKLQTLDDFLEKNWFSDIFCLLFHNYKLSCILNWSVLKV